MIGVVSRVVPVRCRRAVAPVDRRGPVARHRADGLADERPMNELALDRLERARRRRCRTRVPGAAQSPADRCPLQPAAAGNRVDRGARTRRARSRPCVPPISVEPAAEELRVGVLQVAGRGEAAIGARLEVVAERADPAPDAQFDGVPAAGLSTVLRARIEFRTVIVPSLPRATPPPAVPAVPPSLPAIVELTIVVVFGDAGCRRSSRSQLMMPPPGRRCCSTIVELSTVSCPAGARVRRSSSRSRRHRR